MACDHQLSANKKEFYFHVYFHEIFAGVDKTTITVIDPKSDFPNFGETSIMDVPLSNSRNADNKVIARAQGVSIQSSQKTIDWHLSFSIVFETPEFKGSTLQVMGRSLHMGTPREWSIVGGTGVFTMAQGVIYGRRLSSTDDSLWIELKIHGYYTPVPKPVWD